MNGNPFDRRTAGKRGWHAWNEEGFRPIRCINTGAIWACSSAFCNRPGRWAPKAGAVAASHGSEGGVVQQQHQHPHFGGQQFAAALGHTDWQLLKRLPEEPRLCAELTRQKYFRLLQMAKQQGREQIYYIIKTICCTGVRVPEPLRVKCCSLPGAAASAKGRCSATATAGRRPAAPYGGCCSGCAGMPRWTPRRPARCLERLYQQTQEEVAATVSTLMEQAYTQQLLQENQRIGWDA